MPRGDRRPGIGEVAALPADLPRFHRADARQRLQQLGLAVAGDPGDADDLAPPHREADALHALDAERRPRPRGPRPPAPSRPARAGVLSTRRVTLRPTISSASCSGVVSAVGSVATTRPCRITVTTSVTSRISRSLCVMSSTRLALGAQRPQDAEEVVGLLRREDGGRLVEDQEVGAAIERLEDLHALALADAEIGDARVGIDLQVVLAAQALELGARARQPRAEPEAALDAEHDVFQHRERLHQHEVLMHHADPRRQRVLRRLRIAAGSPSHEDLAAIRPVIAVQDAHQRRLAGAVLADDAVDRSAARERRSGSHGPRRTTCRSWQLDRRATHFRRHAARSPSS